MVNSRNDEAMANRVEQLEKKVDDLAVSVDRRFDAVDAAFVEQRQYTEFAFEKLGAMFGKLETKMDARFDRLERTLGQFITRFGAPKRGPRRR